MKVHLGDELMQQVFWITECIALGRFATEGRCEYLVEQGINRILNVSDAASVVSPATHCFDEVVHCPLLDVSRIPDDAAISILDTLHSLLTPEGARVYVHCTAGQLRSPTIVWLYLVACGIDPHEAGTLIGKRAPDAAPGHSKLVDEQLVVRVMAHGRDNFLPPPREDILRPVEI